MIKFKGTNDKVEVCLKADNSLYVVQSVFELRDHGYTNTQLFADVLNMEIREENVKLKEELQKLTK